MFIFICEVEHNIDLFLIWTVKGWVGPCPLDLP